MEKENKLLFDGSDYDESKGAEYEKKYSVKMKCVNCGFSSSEYFLLKGNMITKNILENSICGYCDCKSTLVKDFIFNKVVSRGGSSSSNSNDSDYLGPGLIGFGLGLMFGG